MVKGGNAPDAHLPVMLDEVIQALNIKPNGFYVDATFGRGGHATAIVQRLGSEGRLLAIDRDPQALAAAQRLFADDERVVIRSGPFSDLGRLVEALGWAGRVDGVLLDLGVSSPQLDDAARGFSFRFDGPLDMRMDPRVGISAAEWLARASADEITTVLRDYGEERFARRIANAIVEARREQPLTTTGQLAALVAAAVPTRERSKDPATRTFQAIRIRINNELDELHNALAQLPAVLGVGGRLVVLSFHSLEDRLVKQFMRDAGRGPALPKGLPVRGKQAAGWFKLVGKKQRPSEAEMARNPRARSATLRVAERVAEAA